MQIQFIKSSDFGRIKKMIRKLFLCIFNPTQDIFSFRLTVVRSFDSVTKISQALHYHFCRKHNLFSKHVMVLNRIFTSLYTLVQSVNSKCKLLKFFLFYRLLQERQQRQKELEQQQQQQQQQLLAQQAAIEAQQVNEMDVRNFKFWTHFFLAQRNVPSYVSPCTLVFSLKVAFL